MKQYFTAGLIVLAVILTSGCHRKNADSAQVSGTDSLEVVKPWTKIVPEELELKPIDRIANDWMALSVGDKRSMNSMTISWGTIGQLWNKPVFIVFVSSDRYTKRLMDANRYFTVTAFPQSRELKEALVYIGSHSQREEPDKTANAGLTVEYTTLGNPIISEGNLAIECQKIYSEEFDKGRLPADIRDNMYANLGLHTLYIGEIVNIWTREAEDQDSSLYQEATGSSATK